MESTRPFRVIIIGAAVSGLTLAHMLERAGIDYVVLERGAEVAFAGGASIGLQPNALRIMDQLGLYENIRSTTVPLETAFHRGPDGSVLSASKFASEIERRHGYPILFFEREELLQILYSNLKDKSRIFCLHKVVDIRCNQQRATAVIANGKTFHGDIIVGADGVHSFTRQAIWKGLERTEPELALHESTSMTCEYACVFGVSTYESDDPEMLPGTSHITYSKKRSGICIVTSRNKKFWFLILKLDKKYAFPNIPRYNAQDIDDALTKNSDLLVTKTTRYGDLSKRRSKLSMVALEEVVFKRWFDERITILGDAAHKVTPNAGHGGNTAIESATMLANRIYEAGISESGPRDLSYYRVLAILEEYQNSRIERVTKAFSLSAVATRLQAVDNLLWKFLGFSILPLFGEEAEVNASSELLLGGPPLEFITYKGRAGSIPWNGWTPRSLMVESINGSLSLRTFRIISKASPVVPLAILLAKSVWSAPVLTESIFENIRNVSTTGNKMDTLICFLDLLPFATIAAVELLRIRNTLLQPFILSITCAAFFTSTKLLGVWVVLMILAFTWALILFPQAHGYTLSISSAPLVSRGLVFGAVLIAAFCSPLQHIIWPNAHISQGILISLGLACPLFIPLSILLFNSAIGRESSNLTYGHEDLPQVKQAYFIGFAVSVACHFTHLARAQLFKLPIWTPHGMITLAGLFILSVNGLWSAPARQHSVAFGIKFGVLMTALVALLGPGGTACLLWLWREDKVRCRA